MFVFGLIVALVLLFLGIFAGTYLQYKTSWPWPNITTPPKSP